MMNLYNTGVKNETHVFNVDIEILLLILRSCCLFLFLYDLFLSIFLYFDRFFKILQSKIWKRFISVNKSYLFYHLNGPILFFLSLLQGYFYIIYNIKINYEINMSFGITTAIFIIFSVLVVLKEKMKNISTILNYTMENQKIFKFNQSVQMLLKKVS
jgi:hypothetical protein